MPWCEACDRFLSPSTVKVDGTCPSCGREVDAGHAHAAALVPVHTGADTDADPELDDEDDDLPPIPWHLWLLIAALTVYLGYRAMQGIEWVLG